MKGRGKKEQLQLQHSLQKEVACEAGCVKVSVGYYADLSQNRDIKYAHETSQSTHPLSALKLLAPVFVEMMSPVTC